jgi:hypothetical protein
VGGLFHSIIYHHQDAPTTPIVAFLGTKLFEPKAKDEIKFL